MTSDIKSRPEGASLRETFEQLKDRPDLLGVETVDPAALDFGIKLKRLRLNRGVTQKQLELASGIHQSAISAIERGLGVEGPSYRTMSILLGALEAEISFEDIWMPTEETISAELGLSTKDHHSRIVRWNQGVEDTLFLCHATLEPNQFEALTADILELKPLRKSPWRRHISTILEIAAGKTTTLFGAVPILVMQMSRLQVTFIQDKSDPAVALGCQLFEPGERITLANEGSDPVNIVVSTVTDDMIQALRDI